MSFLDPSIFVRLAISHYASHSRWVGVGRRWVCCDLKKILANSVNNGKENIVTGYSQICIAFPTKQEDKDGLVHCLSAQ